MATWSDAAQSAKRMPEAERGSGHEGLPAYDVHGTHFARYREIDGHEVLQFWCRDAGDTAYYREKDDTYFNVHTFTRCTSVWVWLEHVTADVVRELVAESWATRAPKTLVAEWRAEGGPGISTGKS